MKRADMYGVLFSTFVLFMYVLEIHIFFMPLIHNNATYAFQGYREHVLKYFTNHLYCFFVFWLTSFMSGILSPIRYVYNCIKIAYILVFLGF